MDVCGTQSSKKERNDADEVGEYWRCTLIEPATRLRVGRGLGQTETQAAIELWQHVKRRDAHRELPPPVVSDGWGGHREALLEVYGQVPAYSGRGRPPTCKQPRPDWHYTQMVKQRDAQGHLTGLDIRVIYGDDTTLCRTGTRTVYVERTNLTSRHMTARLTRKTLGFSKQGAMLRAASNWEDTIYNLARAVRTLRIPVVDPTQRWPSCSPAMKAGLTDHIWSIHELLTHIPVPVNPF